MKTSCKKVDSNGRAVPPAAFLDTAAMFATLLCAWIIGAFLGMGL